MSGARIIAGLKDALRGLAACGAPFPPEKPPEAPPEPRTAERAAPYVEGRDYFAPLSGAAVIVGNRLPDDGIVNVSHYSVSRDSCIAAIAREAFAPLNDAMIARPPLPAAMSANQIMLHVRGALERLEWLVPHHDGPLRLTPDSLALLRAHAGDAAAGLVALLTLPIAPGEPAPDQEPPYAD